MSDSSELLAVGFTSTFFSTVDANGFRVRLLSDVEQHVFVVGAAVKQLGQDVCAAARRQCRDA